jgi:uncharacterized protein YaaR (DUF327 family)
MRIENRIVDRKNEGRRKGSVERPPGFSFLETLQKLDESEEIPYLPEEISETDLRNLAGLIEQAGEQLSRAPEPEAFLRYRKHVKQFLRLVQDNLEIISVRTRDRKDFSQEKVFATIENVNTLLAKLAESVLAGEKNRLNTLQLVQSIKGLIIDMVS